MNKRSARRPGRPALFFRRVNQLRPKVSGSAGLPEFASCSTLVLGCFVVQTYGTSAVSRAASPTPHGPSYYVMNPPAGHDVSWPPPELLDDAGLDRLFTVSRLDAGGRPMMDPGSSTYAATFDGKNALASLVEAEYLRRGGGHFRQVVALGDGVAWIWAVAGDLYPHATHITDIYHAREHLHDLAAHLEFISPDPAAWLEDRSAELDAGNIEAIITAARAYPLAGTKASELDRKLGYFERNIHRMRYARFRNLGMFTGSGAIEGGLKAIVVQRAKQSGMHWTTEGAADIITLRCQQASGRWNDFVAPRPVPAARLRPVI